MPMSLKRTIMQMGHTSYVITLPKGWIDYYKLSPGDKVEIIISDDGLLVRPIKINNNSSAD